MLVLALAMLPLLLIPLLADLSATADRTLLALNWFVWAAFAAELAVKTYLAPRRRRYLVTHWLDVLIVVLPFLRPLRIVRSARVLRLLRTARLVSASGRVLLSARLVAQRRGVRYTLVAGVVLVVAIAGLVAFVEHEAEGRSIADFPTALWWAATTVTTVGYGDTAPVTPEGRGLGVLLMIVGIGAFSVITANLAAFLLEDEGEASADELVALREQIETLTRELEGRAGDR